MDSPLRDALARLCATHRLGPSVRRDLDAFVEMLVDPRLQLTEAPPDESSAQGARGSGFDDLGSIGRGGMGEVRRVREHGLGRVVAMKVLRDASHLAWFEREARLTASLDHPGVLPLYAFGALPDGRRFFTLREGQGRTLREALDEPIGRTLRRLCEALRRAAETVAYAHARGVLHRDLKPENLLLGDFGEVWVLDWGIAGPVGETPGAGVGTPRYMSPEHAAGAPLGPQTDVWALGALLHEVVAGRPALPGDAARVFAQLERGGPPRLGLPVDPELARIVACAMASSPGDRYPEAGAFAAALGAWLEGTRAREEARRTVAEARAAFARVSERRARANASRVAAAAILREVPRWAPAEAKEPAWAAEEEAAREDAEAVVEEAEGVELTRAALQRCPDLDEGHALLAEHFRRRLAEAEAVDDPAAPRIEAQLRAHDTGRNAAWIAGDGWVTLVTEPSGARVTACPFVPRARRLVPGEPRLLGVTPLERAPLPRGSWMLVVEAEGRRPVRYPVFLRRGEHWDGLSPSGAQWPVALPADLGPDEVYIPAGWFQFGGDERAYFGQPGERRWLDAFVIDRFAVTNADWLRYLHGLLAAGDVTGAHAAVPRERAGQLRDVGVPIYGFDGERFFLKRDGDGDEWQPDWPVMMIDHTQARGYAAWRAASTGRSWRLVSGAEHEKAARGVDARLYPWGNGHDPSFSCCAGSHSGAPSPASVWSFPIDESVYGVRGLAGGARTWCSDTNGDGRIEIRGSYWNAGGLTGRVCARFFYAPTQRNVDAGLRLARSLP